MATPLNSGKQTVNLASGEVRVSRIRREPPPVLKIAKDREPGDHDQLVVTIGICTFALALFVIYLGFLVYYK